MYQVRDGKRVVPTCPECGCRLRSLSESYPSFMGHFQTEEMGQMRDARGHECEFATMGAYVHPNEILFWSTGPHWNPAPKSVT